MTHQLKYAALIALSLICSEVCSANPLPGHFILEAGAYQSTQGRSQMVNINGLIGDWFSVTKRHDVNGVLGAGYLVDGLKRARYSLDYGINIFYLAQTKVSGKITQELAFTNLAYDYYLTNIPVYAFAKATVNTPYNDLAVTLDVGLGPNYSKMAQYKDTSLDGITQPDQSFSGDNTRYVFSAMAGIGLKLKVFKQVPLELGYRFFYLGKNHLDPRTTQVLNTLQSGNNYAQALMLTVYI
jgi:opacity protein-like surface antigen